IHMADRLAQLDTTYQVVTPENIGFEYRIAGPFRRLPAYLFDFLIRAVVIFVLTVAALIAGVAGWLSSLGWATGLLIMVALVLVFVFSFFYGGLFEAYWNGQTPGKRLMGIRVVSVDGSPITGLQAVLRNLLRFVDAFPLAPITLLFGLTDAHYVLVMTYQVGLFSAMLSPRYQRVGDVVSGTLVIVEERAAVYGVARVDEPEVLRLAASLPIGFDVTKSLGKALSSYVERRRYFPPGRRADIAKHLGEPLRRKFNLPAGTSHDLILCALYYRAFIAEQSALESTDVLHSPFAQRRTPTPQPTQAIAALSPAGGEPVYEVAEIVTQDQDADLQQWLASRG
ncbi:MAG: RDD family protein, partial [Pirellulales bacterium]